MMSCQINTGKTNSAEIKETAKIKVQAEKRAYEIVKLLLEKDITPGFLMESVLFLNPQHFQDVIEERSILEMCGYPLCKHALTNIPAQQYKIYRNKVYDLSKRKHFCSNQCYKASQHLGSQISDSPLWLRNPKTMEAITLVTDGSEMIGDPVELVFAAQPEGHSAISAEKNNIKQPKNVKQRVRFTEPQRQDPFQIALGKIEEWLTKDSLVILKFIDVPMELQAEHTSVEQQLTGQSIDKAYVAQKDTGLHYCQRVEEFYKRQFRKPQKESIQSTESDTDFPMVDNHDQIVIRRKILYENLTKVTNDLFPSLPPSTLANRLKPLVGSFELTSSNVCIKTSVMPLISILIVHLLDRNDETIHVDTLKAEPMLEVFVKALNLNLNNMRHLMDQVISQKLRQINEST